MALYRLSVSNISRSQGRSIVAAAAYRAGERLVDERYDKVQDYSRRKEVVHTEMMLPEGAQDWMKDRATLWNTVEKLENRKDARLAREVQLALPRELSPAQNITLVRDFVHRTFTAHGMAADVSIHDHVNAEGEAQPHAHVLLATRPVTADGFAVKKEPAWDKTELLCQWRESWQDFANRQLALAGFDIQIDHRSNAARGLDLEPQHKIGAAVAQQRLARLIDHQRIARENGERLAADPRIALEALSRQQSTFTDIDLARFINRHTDTDGQFQTVYARVRGCAALVSVGVDARGQERLTTKEMRALEAQMMAQASTLHRTKGG